MYKQKTSKTTNTQRDKKYLQKYYGVHFVLIISCWALGLPLSVVIKPSETPLEKTKFSFVSGCQLEITFLVRNGSL